MEGKTKNSRSLPVNLSRLDKLTGTRIFYLYENK